MYCKYCGKEISEDIKFCPHCGARVDTQVIIVQNEQPKQEPIVVTVAEQQSNPKEGWRHAAANICLGVSLTNIPLAFFLPLYTILTSTMCIVFGIFGTMSNKHRGKAITGLVFSSINLFVATLVLLGSYD